MPRVHKDLMPFYLKNGKRSRASIHIHKTLKDSTWELTQFTTRDQVAIKIRTERNKELILASAYFDGSTNFPCPPPELKPMVDYASQHKLPLIIGVDANARHHVWGNEVTNERGEKLLDYLVANDLTWCNIGKIPTFDNGRLQSINDLTLVNKEAEDLVKGWHVRLKPNISDHNNILFEVEHLVQVAQPKRVAKNTNWDGYDATLSVDKVLKDISQNPPKTIEELNKAASNIKRSITKAIEDNCPISYIPNSLKDPPR